MLLQGLFVPLTCPFYRDGASYMRKLEHNVRRYSLGPAAGLVALSPASEAAALTDAEAYEVLETIGQTASSEKVLIAGVERSSVHAALLMTEKAASAGFDAILLSPPVNWSGLAHNSLGSEILLYYQAVADASPLPVVLWNDVSSTKLRLPPEVLIELAHTANIVGLIDAGLTAASIAETLANTADVRHQATVTPVFEAVTRRMVAKATAPSPVTPVQGLVTIGGSASAAPVAVSAEPAGPSLKTRTRTVGFQVLSAGQSHEMLPLLLAGATGAMPPLAASAPQGCYEVYAAWKDGDSRLAAERAERLRGADALITELGQAAVKYGCDWNGYFGGQPRLPLLGLTAEQRLTVEQALGEVRN